MPTIAPEDVLPSDAAPETLPSDMAEPLDLSGAPPRIPQSSEELAIGNAQSSLGAAATIRKGISDAIMARAILPSDQDRAKRLVFDLFNPTAPAAGVASQIGAGVAAPFTYAGRVAKGLVEDTAAGWGGENKTGVPFENTVQAVTSPTDFKTPLPVDQQLDLARQDEAEHGGLPWRSTLADISTGLATTAPKIAAIALAPATLPAQMAGSGLLFGLDDEGNFSLKEAGLMAMLPGVGAGARAVVARSVAKGMEAGIAGLDKPIVQRALALGGDQLAMNAYMLAMQTPELAELRTKDPAKFWETIGTTIGQNAAFAGLHVFKGGEAAEGKTDSPSPIANGKAPETDQDPVSALQARLDQAGARPAGINAEAAKDAETAAESAVPALSDPNAPIAYHPDGTVDPITTALNRMRQAATDEPGDVLPSDTAAAEPTPAEAAPATKADVLDLAQEQERLQRELQEALANPFKPQQSEVSGLESKVEGPELPSGEDLPPPSIRPEVENVGPEAIGSDISAVEAPKTRKGGKPSFFIHPRPDGVPDILDAIQDLGGIAPPGDSAGGEYDGYPEAYRGAARLLFKSAAYHRPDTIIHELHNMDAVGSEEGTSWQKIQTPDDLWNAIKSATAEREKIRAGGGGYEAQADRFWSAVSKPENRAGFEKINADQLQVGQQFRLKAPGAAHDLLTVAHLDPDTGEVTVKDGPKFGAQDLPPGAEIYIKAGSLVEGDSASPAVSRPVITAKGKTGNPLQMTREEYIAEETRRWGTTPEEEGTAYDKLKSPPQEVRHAAGGSEQNGLTGDKSQQSIRKAINEKHEAISRLNPNPGQGWLANFRRRAESAFRSVAQREPLAFRDAQFDPDYGQTEQGRQLQALARAHGTEVVFFKADPYAPKGGFVDGTLYLKSTRTPEEIAQTFEHELAHHQDIAGNAQMDALKKLVDLNSAAAKQFRTGYDQWLKQAGKQPLNDALAREEIAAHFVSAENPYGANLAESFAEPKQATQIAREYHGAHTPAEGKSAEPQYSAGEYLPSEDEMAHGKSPMAKPERERGADQVKTELAQADTELRKAITVKNSDLRGTEVRAAARQAVSLATARRRGLQEELLHHPDYIAEQLAKEHAALTEVTDLLKPHGIAINPDEYPNVDRAREALTPEEFARYQKASADLEAAHGERVRMPKLLVSRVYGEMQADGRLPKSAPLYPDAGRTLDRMTQFLKANEFDSPRDTWAERLALGRRFAETVAGVKDTVSRTMLDSQAAWKATVETFKHPILDGDFRTTVKNWLGYDQRTSHENYQYVKALLDKVPSSDRRKAMSIWLDADGDQGLLRMQGTEVPEAYRRLWDLALRLTPDEKRIAMQVKENFAVKLDDALATGLVKKGREDYGVPQRWKVPPEIVNDAKDPFGEGHKGKPGNPYAKLDPRDPFFSFQRQTPTYFEGIMQKGVPENLDMAHLVSVYDASFHKALSSRGAIAALQDATAKDGQPVVKISGRASAATGADGGKAYFVDSKAHAAGDVAADGRPYRSLDHFALKDWKVRFKDDAGNPIIVKGDMLIHPDHFEFLKNELETPAWTQKGLGAAALKTSSFLKSSKFIGPFHIVTEALHATFHGVIPSVHGFDIDLTDPKQALLNRNMVLGFGRAREMFEDGLSSHGGIWAKVPGLGDAIVKLNNFTFSEYIPRLKMKVGLAVLDRNIARYSKDSLSGKALTMEQIAEVTGRQMDAAFGGQNWRLMGANKGTLAVMRLGLVAPDFLISRAKVVGQAFKPYNAEQRIFLLAQAASVYGLCRVANALFSDDNDPHFEPKNWDSVVIGKRAYHARFIVSDAANLARDLMGGYSGFKQNGIPFITGRLGVVPKTTMEAVSGKDLFTGANKDGLFDTDNPLLRAFSIVAKDTAEWMTPMGVDGFLPGAAKAGQTGLGSAAVATVGVSSRKESPSSDVWNLARQSNLASKDPLAVQYQKRRDNETGLPSDYRALNNLLDAGQLDKAKAEVAALEAAGKTEEQITKHYERNTYYTGSQAREEAFTATLTPPQKKLYERAQAEKAARAANLAKVLSPKS